MLRSFSLLVAALSALSFAEPVDLIVSAGHVVTMDARAPRD